MRRLTVFTVSMALLLSLPPREARPLMLPYQLVGHGVRVSHIAVVGDSYTTGTDEGGQGPAGWTTRAWQMLDQDGTPVAAEVAAEGGAGYGVPGNRGGVFADLTARAVRPDNVLVVFFGSRNDEAADLNLFGGQARDAFALARRIAPSASLLVIGPPWPTIDVPEAVLRVRDILGAESRAAHAEFVDPLAQGWFVGRPDLIGGDGVHPNDAGHTYLADKITPLIRAKLPLRL